LPVFSENNAHIYQFDFFIIVHLSFLQYWRRLWKILEADYTYDGRHDSKQLGNNHVNG